MNWLISFIGNQVVKSIMSWETTALSGLTAFLGVLLTQSGIIDPQYVHSLAGQAAQWALGAVSLVLLAWQDRKQPAVDTAPTQPPQGDQ